MRKTFSIFILINFILAGCGPSVQTISIQTADASTEIAARWTATPTILPSEAPTDTITAVPTGTLFPHEVVRVEDLNPDLWYMVVRDQVDVGTYKRVMEGDYWLVRDDNGRIVEAYDDKGESVDTILFSKGEFGFGWEAVTIDENFIGSSASVPVINLGEIVKTSQEINGTKYDFSSVRILVGVGDGEFREYLMPIVTVLHEQNDVNMTLDSLSIEFENYGLYEVIGEEKIADILVRKDNVYKQILVSFNIARTKTYSELIAYRGIPYNVAGDAYYSAQFLVINDLDRYRLISQHEWPKNGEIFAFATGIGTALEGLPPE